MSWQRSITETVPPEFSGYAAIPLRVIVGIGFLQHGYAKLSKGPEAFATILQALQVPAPHIAAYLTIAVELLGGTLLLFGAYVSLVSIPTIAILLTAIFTVHLPYGFSSIKLKAVVDGRAQFGPPGYECDLLYIACISAIVLLGSGAWSIDAYRLSRAPESGALLRRSPLRDNFVTKRTTSPR